MSPEENGDGHCPRGSPPAEYSKIRKMLYSTKKMCYNKIYMRCRSKTAAETEKNKRKVSSEKDDTMNFIDQLKAEVQIHGDMETDFRSRRYHQARNIAAKYIDIIEEQARIAARNGDYERIEGHALIKGFCPLNEKDFDMAFVQVERKRRFLNGKKQETYTMIPENELFEVFLSAFRHRDVLLDGFERIDGYAQA